MALIKWTRNICNVCVCACVRDSVDILWHATWELSSDWWFVCVSKCVWNVRTVILLSEFNRSAELQHHRQFCGLAVGTPVDALGFWCRKVNERGHMDDVCRWENNIKVDAKEQKRGAWTVFTWFRTKASGGLLWPPSFTNCREFLTEKPLICEEWLSSVDLVSK